MEMLYALTETTTNLVDSIAPITEVFSSAVTPAQVVELLSKGVEVGIPFFLAVWAGRKILRIVMSAISKGKISF